MRNILTISRREVAAYFNSPIAYIFMILFIFILSFLFFVFFPFFSQTNPDLRNFFFWFPWVLSIFIPAVTMRLWSEERRSGTIELLLTWPLQAWEVVVGKYLAGLFVIAISLILTLVVPISLSSSVSSLDWGVIFTSYLGALLISSVYIALGSWASTLTNNQIVSLLIAIAFSLVMVGIGYPPVVKFLNALPGLGNFIGWFGTDSHFREFSKGLINPVGLIYGFSLTVFFLVLNNLFVEGRKF
ncbi:MAG: ABC transporter permease subunit [Planctomycetota bacterium]|nr:ABC transporter permease subunit [Planctomycetota bacterium]MEE3296102.1 ABC transporter permease subunit [Planctomycetota bacterium]